MPEIFATASLLFLLYGILYNIADFMITEFIFSVVPEGGLTLRFVKINGLTPLVKEIVVKLIIFHPKSFLAK